MSRWSLAGLCLWLANAVLAATIAAGLVFGPQLADRAWAEGIHVTPAQAAMHAALMASGFTHHHGATRAPASSASSSSPTVEPSVGGSIWGLPLSQAIGQRIPELGLLTGQRAPEPDQPEPAGPWLTADSPPPEGV